ncbi:hypothetical protein [Streptomyces sp. R41]|uniref:Uncharacterized protein n=1 Tax=Streptomyces sp. R41 TaxID=3238632 RepID=A0AB39RBF8_9ACTN
MSPMWDDKPEHTEGICVACGQHTDNGIVRWLPRTSGPDVRLIVHAEGNECWPKQPVEPIRLASSGL